jgi:hypothetical protein
MLVRGGYESRVDPAESGLQFTKKYQSSAPRTSDDTPYDALRQEAVNTG